MHSFQILVPSLTVEMAPETSAALTVLPYNIVTLRCVANVPETVLIEKYFEWRESDNVISDNGNSILISDHNTSQSESLSELTVINPSVGSYTYVCVVSLLIQNGLGIDGNASGVVTVRGKYVDIHNYAMLHEILCI